MDRQCRANIIFYSISFQGFSLISVSNIVTKCKCKRSRGIMKTILLCCHFSLQLGYYKLIPHKHWLSIMSKLTQPSQVCGQFTRSSFPSFLKRCNSLTIEPLKLHILLVNSKCTNITSLRTCWNRRGTFRGDWSRVGADPFRFYCWCSEWKEYMQIVDF